MIEIVIQSDGSLIISRGTTDENQALKELLPDVSDPVALDSFFAITEDSERLFGNQFLCG